MIEIIALICFGATCREHVVASSRTDEQLTMMACQLGQPAVVEWLGREYPGWTLRGWKCRLGDARRAT